MSEATIETVVGVLDGITEKPSGWTEIQVRVDGWQYPVKMATKLQPLIELARAAGNEEMVWTFKKQESDQINQHSGKPYINRYFEKVEPLSAVAASERSDATASPTRAARDGMSKEEWARKDRAADLRACIAIAAGALQHTMKSEPEDADLNEFTRRVLFVGRQFHNMVTSERAGEAYVPFLSEHDDAIPY